MSNLLSTALPETLTFSVEFDRGTEVDSSYFDATIHDVEGEDNIFEGSIFDAYCLDEDRGIGLGPTKKFVGQVYSSYETLPQNLTQGDYIEQAENLDLVNWILNQGFEGKNSQSGGQFSSSDVQIAIWKLVDEVADEDLPTTNGLGNKGSAWTEARVQEIIDLAQTNGEGFVPSYEYTTIFGEEVTGKLGLILVPSVDSEGLPTKQTIIVPVELAKLGDRVWFDNDADGIQDAGEDGIEGVTVNLLADVDGDGDIETDEVIETTTTDEDGNYHFEVAPGEYKVAFEQPEGFSVSPANVGGDDTVDSNGLVSDVVSLAPGEFDPTIDSGFYQLASLGDFVWHDLNADGIQNDGEPGIANATVKLIDPTTGNIIDTTTTDENGLYSFDNLEPGNYKVMFVTPDGFTESSPTNVGSDETVDSNGAMVETTLSAGENDLTLDSGFYNLASIGDYVFIDNNENGIQDTGDTGIGGVTVELLQNGSVIDTTTTNNDGSYLFDGLTPGDYQVKFSEPNNFVFTSENQGGNDNIDSDADNQGFTPIVTLTSGEFNQTVDAGLVDNAPAPIEGIEIEKFVNGIDVNDFNNLPSIVAGEEVIFTYKAKNTGNVDFDLDEVIVTDDNGTPSDTSDDFIAELVLSSDVGGDGILSPDEIWEYTSPTFEAQDLSTTTKEDILFTFKGNSSSPYNYGNTRSFTEDGVSVDVKGFSFNVHNGWQNAYVGAYSGGLGVINRNHDSDHRVDNYLSDDYLVFQFDTEVVVDRAFLKYVGRDSDISYWIGDRDGNITHLNDFILDSFSQGDNFTNHGDDRTADINDSELSGDTFIISGYEHHSNDSFKLHKLDIFTETSSGDGSYINTVTVEAGSVTDEDKSGYVNEVANPGIKLEKFTNGIDVTDIHQLPEIAAGDDVVFTYKVENTGNVSFDLNEIEIVDDNGTPDNIHDDFTPTLDVSSDLNADGILSPGETWMYSSATETAQELTVTSTEDSRLYFNGHSSSQGKYYGNERTFSQNDVSVDITAFSSNQHNNDWKKAHVGDYSHGLGVRNGYRDSHTVDNQGRIDYLLFQFDSDVVVDKAFLDYVGHDSDISYWIGDRDGDISHLNESILDGFSEGKSWGGGYDRWANINSSELKGDTLVISAMRGGSNDSFKLRKLDFSTMTTIGGSYINTATVDTGLVSDSDFSGYINPEVV